MLLHDETGHGLIHHQRCEVFFFYAAAKNDCSSETFAMVGI